MNASRMLSRAAALMLVAGLSACLADAQLAITTSSLPPATSGTAYNATLSATGGTLPYTWSSPGGLPQGLMLNPGSPTATITGIPAPVTTAGIIIDPQPIRFQVMDSQGLTATAILYINTANPIVITTTMLPAGSLGTPYFVCLSATGGYLALDEFWAITAGSLPTGLTLGIDQNCPGFGPAPSAAISGTPSQTGNFDITVQVADPENRMAQMSYTLSIGGGSTTASLNAGPSAVSAGYTIGQAAPAAQVLQISSTGAALAYNASVSYVAGSSGNSSWVSLTNPSGITPATVGVNLMPSGLQAGVYKANVTIASSAASTGAVSVPVTLMVTSGITLILSPPAVTFTYIQGGTVPPPQQVQFTTSSGSLMYSFSVGSGASWLTAIPPGGVNPSTLALSVNPAGLAPGTYSATIQVTASGAVNSPQSLGVTLLVEGATPAITSILNAASLEVGALAPGSIVTIKGSVLGPSTGVSIQPDAYGNYATTLAGAQVLFNGTAAPMLYAQSGQINAVVPFEISGAASAAVQVVYNGVTSASFSLPIEQAAPALFTLSASGTGQGAILNQDSTVNSSSNPAAAGTIVSLFGTGGGPFQTAEGDGTTAGVTNLTLPVTAQIGGVSAQVLYAGSAPGLVAGGFQINVKIPAGTAAGDAAVVIFVNGFASQSPVTVAVH